MQKAKTSWQTSGKWYGEFIRSGSYYHQKIILPQILKLFRFTPQSRVLDLGCGEGWLGRQLPAYCYYQGIDTAEDLIQMGRRQAGPNMRLTRADATKPLPIVKTVFSHIFMILSLQNMTPLSGLVANAGGFMDEKSRLLIVLNHPYFRIPRLTGWEIDPQNSIQYRRTEAYMSLNQAEIITHPGKDKSPRTVSFHYPLYYISQSLQKENLCISHIDEWVSDKHSQGKFAVMENTARREFPLFMALVCRKHPL